MKWILSLFLVGSLFSEEVSFSVDAKEMEYDSHAEKMSGKDVTITFKDGSKLMGRSATLRFDQKTGSMTSDTTEDPVIFTGLMVKEGEAPRHIMVKSSEVAVEVVKEEALLVTALRNVQIFIDDEYVAYGNKATFQNSEFGSSSGIVTLEGEKGRIEKNNGDTVLADKLLFNPFAGKLEGWAVDADLGSAGIRLKAARLEWLPKTGFLSFSDEVEVTHGMVGSLSSHGKLQLQQGAAGGVEMVFAEGPVTAKSIAKGVSLSSFGELHVDNIGHKMVVKSPLGEGGEPIFSTQAYFEDETGRIYADLFEIKYRFNGTEAIPESVEVKGHVRLQSKMISRLEQYAIADELQYSPKTGEMKLLASKGKRVLYFDKGQGVEVSAPAITVQRGLDKDVEFHGKGNVRLKFTPDDLDQMKKYFPGIK